MTGNLLTAMNKLLLNYIVHDTFRCELLRAISLKQEKHVKLSDADKAFLKESKVSAPETVLRIRTEVRQELQNAKKARVKK